MTIVALKVIALTHKLHIYCPQLSSKTLGSLYQKTIEAWDDILVNKTKNPKDQFRCEFFATFIGQYSNYLDSKCKLIDEFANLIDAGYSLTKYFNDNQEKSPLQLPLL